MAVAGVQKSALEWKRRKRTCPSCGRPIEGRTCAHHT
jgi:NADH pyrophosphatase NudC (nudix superfamily)